MLLLAAVTGRMPGGLVVLVVAGLVVILVLGIRQGGRETTGGDRQASRVGRNEMRRSFPVRLAFWGFLLVPASAVVGAAAGNATGVFAVFPLLVFAVIAALVLRIIGRGLVAALVVGVLLLLASIELGLFHLGHPESFSDFVPTVMRLAGLALAVVGTSFALTQRRRGLRPTATQMQRRALVVGGSLLVALAIASGVLTVTQPTGAVAANGATVVTLKGDRFIPSVVHVRPGEAARVLVRNIDGYAHTFTVDDLKIDQYVGPRFERVITFNVPAGAKRFALTCTVTGHERMSGKIIAI
jgi:hypothetical protein